MSSVKKTLRFQIYSAIILTFSVIAIIYSLVLFPFENDRRQTVLRQIEFSLNAIVEQQEEAIANEMFLRHQEAIEIIIKKMLEIEGIPAIGVFNPDGSLLAVTDAAPAMTLTASEREALVQNYSFVETIWNHQKVVMYSRPIIIIGECLGYIKVYYSLAKVIQETRLAMIIFTTLLLTILLSMTVLLNVFLSRFVTRPVGTLMDAMKKVQEGHLGEQVDLHPENEIGKMAQAFNQMSAENARMYQELGELNKHLEQKVTERTEELKRKNIELNTILEEVEKAKNAAESANQAKSRFLANINHELRTPLNGILGYTQILKRDSQVTDAQKEGLDVIERCGTHLLHLITEILDLAIIEAQKLEIQTTDFLLPECLAGLTSMIRALALQKHLVFEFKPAPDLARVVHGDEKHLSQVLLNLLSNAVKFTEQGYVTLRVMNVHDLSHHEKEKLSQPSQAISRQKASIHFSIEDTGVGIPAEQLEAIFSPFVQISGYTQKSEGTGLGLAISRELVQAMGGTLQVRSEMDRGSTFWFELHLPEVTDYEPAPASRKRRIAGFRGKSRKVLVVDDNRENRMMLVELLLPLGFTTREAKNGKEAVHNALTWKPDAILLDLIMPEMDGYTAAQTIRDSDSDVRNVPILAVSASISESLRQKAQTAGCSDFICKPIDVDELFQKIEGATGLEWVYANEHSSDVPFDIAAASDSASRGAREREFDSRSEAIIAPSEEDLAILSELVEDGDYTEFQRYLKHLANIDQRHRPFIEILRRFATSFQEHEIQTFIAAHQEGKG